MIPLDQCSTFAVYPLRWLRSVGFTIYGREGHLSKSKTGPPAEIDDYTADMEAPSYYFVPEGEARLVDPDVMDNRTSNVSSLTDCRHDFRTNVIGRDGARVITSDLDSNCTACHIIPHNISNAVRHRGGTDGSADDINDINDTRNGILLSNLLRQPFGSGKLAFLRTPNFVLSVDDIPYEPLKDEDQQSPASRLTLHHFANLGSFFSEFRSTRHNSDARQPHDTSEWPPAIIVDLSYAAAAMKAWSSLRSSARRMRQKFRSCSGTLIGSRSRMGTAASTLRRRRLARS
ncbi:hypothetical protein AX14_001769 [Amanita brunnescens Koide BX004]|nr:hypothetical protein AX14_001769 [Amanita brunnescens Koide BX004]